MPGVMDMASSMGGMSINSKESVPADTGINMGNDIRANELAARSMYAQPFIPEQGKTFSDGEGVPYYMNQYPAPPRKYSVPTAEKEYFVAKEAIRQAAQKNNQNRPDPITNEEVNYLQTMQSQAELADFDAWVNAKYDPKRPGGLTELLNIYPDFVTSRVKQAATDYSFALRKEMIDCWGVQSFDDMFFQYLCDQGKISGPKLTRQKPRDDYTEGALSPFFWKSRHLPKTGTTSVALPGSSSSYGPKPADETQWRLRNDTMPFQDNRSIGSLANQMYNVNKADAFVGRENLVQPNTTGRESYNLFAPPMSEPVRTSV